MHRTWLPFATSRSPWSNGWRGSRPSFARRTGQRRGTRGSSRSSAIARIRASAGDPDAGAWAPEKPPAPESSGNARLVLALVAAVAVVGAALVFVWRGEAPAKVTSPADPTSVAEARREASKAGLPAAGRLLGMTAWYVSPDGMLHASPAYAPRVEYVFAAPPARAKSAPRPIGAPDNPAGMFENEYAVTLTPGDSRVEQTLKWMHAAVPDPHCLLVDVWKAAEAAGAPAEAVAVIVYAEGTVSTRVLRGDLSRVPRWHFEIASTPPFEVDVSDPDCTIIR